MRVDLLGQLCHTGALSPFFIIFFLGLLFRRGLNGRVIRQGYLSGILEKRRLREVNSVHGYHLALREPEPLSLEDDFTT